MKILPLKNVTASKNSLFRSDAMQRVMAFGALILLFIGFSIASPYFFKFDNIVGILLATAVNGVLALGVLLGPLSMLALRRAQATAPGKHM